MAREHNTVAKDCRGVVLIHFQDEVEMKSTLWICLPLALLLGCTKMDTKSKNSKDTDKATSSSTSIAPKVASNSKFEFTNAVFESPTIVKFGGDENYKHTRYPSPALFDVDNDGANELVLGDLFGKLVACENENPGKGDPVWSEPEAIKSADGVALNMENW